MRRPDPIETMRPRRRRGIVVWDGPRPVDVDDHTPDEAAEMLTGVLKRIAEHVANPPIVQWICEDCGCSLRTRDELCPACALAWCQREAVRGTWRTTTFYRPDHQIGAA